MSKYGKYAWFQFGMRDALQTTCGNFGELKRLQWLNFVFGGIGDLL